MNALIYLALTPGAASQANTDAAGRISRAFGARLDIIAAPGAKNAFRARGIAAASIEDFADGGDAARLAAQPQALAQAVVSALSRAADPVIAVLAPHAQTPLDVLPTVAAAMRMPFVPNICAIDGTSVRRLICASRVIQTLALPQMPFCATFQSSAAAEAVSVQTPPRMQKFPTIARDALKSFVPFAAAGVDLDSAQIVFSGGRGLESKENFELLEKCAAKFNAAVAASRCAVDLGWARSDLQVGQTGKTIAPDLYIAFGISGAVQHMAGMRQSRAIAAVNSDADAPIFEAADFGICASARQVLEYLMNC